MMKQDTAGFRGFVPQRSSEHEELLDRAMRSISRNLLRYQLIEQGLKRVLPGPSRPECEAAIVGSESRKDAIASETLGNLHRRLTEFLQRAHARGTGFVEDESSRNARAERERRVIDDRNRLVHHLDHCRFSEPDDCRSLVAELDDAFERAEEMYLCVHWLTLGTAMVATGSNGDMQQPESTNGDSPAGDSMQTQQDAIAALRRICKGEWMPLSQVGNLLYAEVPGIQERIRKGGGLQMWIAAIGALELRKRSLGDTQTQAEIRLRPRVSVAS